MKIVTKELKMRIWRIGMRFSEKGREWRIPGLFYANDLVLCDKTEEDLKLMVRSNVR